MGVTYIAGQEVGKLDWGEIWSGVSVVTPAEREEMTVRLEPTPDRISGCEVSKIGSITMPSEIQWQ